jgi:hemerythrin-like domain-containing protein
MFSIGKLHDPIGPLVPDVSDPFALLTHCHKRIEGQLLGLEFAVELFQKKTFEDSQSAFILIDAALAHFAGPGVKHTEDEEISLFPRMREKGGNAGEEVFAAMNELEAQHRTAKELEAEFENFIANLPRQNELEAKDLEQMTKLVEEITKLYRPHIKLEDTLVFPVGARILTEEDVQALGSEILARRRVMLQRS